ncbi:MAG: reductive dehalogenase [Candidatus Neomarinimicrobiota bacterium]|nr:reductive dehalogenase [Candidatus Neomarinimicrobiota bacterium]
MTPPQGKCQTCGGGCASDSDAGFEISNRFERFSQKDDIFNRSFWDSAIRSEKTDAFYESYRKPLQEWRHVDGYHQKDFALRNAGWHVADLFAERLEDQDRREGFLDYLTSHREGASEKRDIDAPGEMSKEIKKVAKLFGAELVGITYFDERWVYTHKYSRQSEDELEMDLPEELTSAIVVCHEMDHNLLKTVPSALSGTATGLGYSQDAVTLLALAQYIQNLGYTAVASMNDTALSIPLAIKAGLGEYGRHGLLITPELGPRLRIGKVFTDLPLAHDRPIRFGVEKFCDICRKCSDACPPAAIPDGEPSEMTFNRSNIPGINKWTVDGEKCFEFWTKQVTDCSICLRVCPYSRPYPVWINRVRHRLMGSFLRRIMLWLDDLIGGGERKQPNWWWTRKVS